mgnify:CR=1 FL=1
MKQILVSDIHLGLRRRAGTTPTSTVAYESLQFEALDSTITDANDLGLPVVVLGDIFDKPTVEYSVLWRAVESFSRVKYGLTLVKGNHDIGGDKERLTAFDMLCLLVPGATGVSEPTLSGNYTIVPHAHNQDIFDEWLTQASGTILTHANFDNFFAVDKDHSLNITPEQAQKFTALISGHEHERRQVGNVTMLGSLLPCNIGEAKTAKGYHIFNSATGDLEFIEVWSPQDSYIEINWADLPCDTDAEFIRVNGEAEFSQGAQVIQAIAEFRKTSGAYFVSNSVKVGDLVLGELDDVEADLDSFNPLEAFWSILGEESAMKIKEIVR